LSLDEIALSMSQLGEHIDSVRAVETHVGRRPSCFSIAQWDGWSTAARDAIAAQNGALPAGPCTDCTPQYQARMIREGRCEHPDTLFSVRAGGGVEGKWSKKKSSQQAT
jgi:hypothetical protein